MKELVEQYGEAVLSVIGAMVMIGIALKLFGADSMWTAMLMEALDRAV